MAYHTIEKAKICCPNGHEYSKTNTYVVPKTGWRQCITCRNSRDAERPSRYLTWRLKREYGLSREEYLQMQLDQDGLCAICHLSPATQVDHDHETYKVRGLLCKPCNQGLGLFKDNYYALTKAAEYIKEGDLNG